MSPQSTPFRLRLQQRGLSLVEILMVVACLSTILAVAFLLLTNTRESVKAIKLRSDVTALNAAFRVYLGTGGSIEPNTAEGAIFALKRKASALSATKIAGLRGSMLDYRLEGVAAGADEQRAVWDDSKREFVIAASGHGFKEFVINPDAQPVTEEDHRQTSFDLAQKNTWIWDYNPNGVTAKSGPKNIPHGAGAIAVAAPSAPVGKVLNAPVFSLPEGYHSITDIKRGLNVTLTNPNPSGSSTILYAVGDGPWKVYEGEKIFLGNAFTTPIKTYAVSQNPNAWTDSIVSKSSYLTTWFSGKVVGAFHHPAGDGGLVSNLLSGKRGNFFDWGSPSILSGFFTRNSLKFEGANFTKVGPGEEFFMGTLTYFNGTTLSNTNATSVNVDFKLDFTTPGGLSDTLKFTFELLSTTNSTRNTLDQNADYVHIPQLKSSFKTTIHGVKYGFKLRFGAHGANGFTTIDTFHTHENQTMSGGVYGTLIAQ